MSRDQFMKELAQQLQSLPAEDRQDALQYYNDYFDEAGPEREAEILRALGSPRQAAAAIRSARENGAFSEGEFTEQGYQDKRFSQPAQELARSANTSRSLLKPILFLIVLCAAVPYFFGIGGSLLGILCVLLAFAAFFLFILGIFTAAALIAGILLIPAGILQLLAAPLNAGLTAGSGAACLGIGLLLLLLSLAFCGQLLPSVFRSAIDTLNRFVHRNS